MIPSARDRSLSPSGGERRPSETLRITALTPPRASRWRLAVRRCQGLALWSAILAAGVALRAWITMDAALGHQADIDLFVHWTQRLQVLGIGGFYGANVFCDYPPLSILMFQVVGWVASLFPNGLADAELLQILLKVPAGLADIAIAVMIYVEGGRMVGKRLATAAAALFFLNPVVLYDSAYWGQVDSIYTAFALLALILVARRRWLWAGAAVAAGLLAKFQTITFLPLLLFEAYRMGGWKAVGNKTLGAVVVAAAVLSPFAWSESLDDVLMRSYVNVVGQYNDLSKSAFNIWYLNGTPHQSDLGVPSAVIRAAAEGKLQIADNASWLLWFSWRKISLAIYALAVAIILSVYSWRPGPVTRFGAAGLLGLAFFLFPTEMHERYAIPALAFLALWAVVGRWQERAFVLLSALLLLNVASILPIVPVARHISVAILVCFGVILVAMMRSRASGDETDVDAARDVPPAVEPPCERRRLIVWFRRATVAAVVAAVSVTGWVSVAAANSPAPPSTESVTYLSSLRPRSVRQGWKTLAVDRSVSGALLHLGGMIYQRGLGTHAPSVLEYDIPDGMTVFYAVAGIDRRADGSGSTVVSVELDGEEVLRSPTLTGDSEPISIEVPLRGARRLTLRARPTADGQRSDHVDWALARFAQEAESRE